jgi:NAD(P)-dependent dehydrogenase (short-subunit alcohol dehydrogenase family)
MKAWRILVISKKLNLALPPVVASLLMGMLPGTGVFGTTELVAADAPTVLITGSNRGIGLELARGYAKKGWQVIATCRKPEKATELQEIAADYPNVAIERLDVTDFEEIDALAEKYRNVPIDVLLNNAGISGGSENQKFGEFNFEAYNKVMAVNVIGPLKMAEAFIEHVEASEQKKIISITSTQGSIARTFGGIYFYRASKAALNMVMKTLSIELRKRGVTVGLVAPGFVRTDFTKGLDFPMMISPEESAAAVIGVIDNDTIEQSGTFVRHTGEEAPW